MLFVRFWATLIVLCGLVSAESTKGIYDLVARRIPTHKNSFIFTLTSAKDETQLDEYTVSQNYGGKIEIKGNSVSAINYGLHKYLTDELHVDIYWFVGSRLNLAPSRLPHLKTPLKGSSLVPWRYHFNTVTFSYTTAFWSWEDWELELDWMALRGVNLPLAWVGQEKILVEVFQEIGLTDDEISSFLSGPAFQAWNRFGNIQGSWGGGLPTSWINSQFELQKKIIARMVELGMTPVLPAFTGFVPRATTRVLPNASIVNGSQWEAFPTEYTNDTFLEPFDPAFTQMQESFIKKQIAAYGNVTHIYTLDQYNENNPYSGDLDYLKNVTLNTWKSLKAADSQAVWMMQAWLFTSNSAFWTNDRVEAYLSGVEENSDMLILDLFSESQPQWQRTNSYYGKPWIWCELHDYGGNQGLYGQIENVTVNPIAALENSSSLIGFGLTMEGQEGNEIMYDLLLDQAWSKMPIDTDTYFHDWVGTRYSGSGSIPSQLYEAWDILRTSAYNNTNLTSNAVPKSILELLPNVTGMLNRTGHHPTTINYDPSKVQQSWSLMLKGASKNPFLWHNPVFQFDMVDITRQVMANAFISLYTDLVSSWNQAKGSSAAVKKAGSNLLALLSDLDAVLMTNENFLLSDWISSARAWASGSGVSSLASFYEYDARNQITLWGPKGQVNDYASKSWGGLVSSYYIPRWQIFIDYLEATAPSKYNTTALDAKLLDFELPWQTEQWGKGKAEPFGTVGQLPTVLKKLQKDWPSIFH